MEFTKGKIEGVVVTPARKYVDDRGWLVETFRHDEMDRTYHPVMGYSSLTLPGVARGPHEHVEQSDYFVFIGPGNFKIWMWDNRKTSSTFNHKMVLFGGADSPLSVLIPPGVVHAYKNVSESTAQVHNYPNQLFMGQKKKYPIDEIRHEDDPNTPYQLE